MDDKNYTWNIAPGALEIGKEESALNRREWMWLVLLAVALLATYASPLKEHLGHVQEIKKTLESFGHLAPLIFVVGMSGLTAIGIPRMALYPIAGIAFGFAAGFAWSLAATLIGAYATFLYSRWAGRGLVLKKWPALAKISTKLDDRGPFSIALLRQLPSPGFLTNLLFGISAVRHRDFILGTALGSIPSAVPAIMLGSSMTKASHEERIAYVGASILVMLTLWISSAAFVRRRSKQNTPG